MQTSFPITYSIRPIQNIQTKNVSDSINIQPQLHVTGLYNNHAQNRTTQNVPFDSISLIAKTKYQFKYEHRPRQNTLIPTSFTAINKIVGKTKFAFTFDNIFFRLVKIVNRYDAIDSWTPIRKTQLSWRLNSVLYSQAKTQITFQATNTTPIVITPTRFNINRYQEQKLLLNWNSIQNSLATQTIHWDSNKKEFATIPLSHQSLVRSGWRVVARNIANNEQKELGFIDTDAPTRSLTNIKLPNGDYEIKVLTSSNFWQDTQSKNIYNIILQDNKELQPQPTIYNLRSSIIQGTTKIEWSSTKATANDYKFACWYSPETPVDTTRPPDPTIQYNPTKTEYETKIKQTKPTNLAITTIQTNKPQEQKNIQYLTLNWNNTKPETPNDIIILNH
jgi:hypothetical protein